MAEVSTAAEFLHNLLFQSFDTDSTSEASQQLVVVILSAMPSLLFIASVLSRVVEHEDDSKLAISSDSALTLAQLCALILFVLDPLNPSTIASLDSRYASIRSSRWVARLSHFWDVCQRLLAKSTVRTLGELHAVMSSSLATCLAKY